MALRILYTGKEAKGLDNRYCGKFMQFGIGLLRTELATVLPKIRNKPKGCKRQVYVCPGLIKPGLGIYTGRSIPVDNS